MSVCCVLACLQLSALSPFWNYILFLFALCEQLLVGRVDVLQSLQTTIRNWKEATQIVMLTAEAFNRIISISIHFELDCLLTRVSKVVAHHEKLLAQ